LLIGNKFDIIKNNQKKEQKLMNDPFEPLWLATKHYNLSRDEFIAKIDPIWRSDSIFHKQAVAHYDQIQKDMTQYERMVNNAV